MTVPNPWAAELAFYERNNEDVLKRVIELRAIVTSIDEGELFAEAPQGDAARRRHAAGVSLLAVLERELDALRAQIDGWRAS